MNRLAICILVSCLGFCSQASGQSGIITTVAGNGTIGFSGDGGPATSGSLKSSSGVTVDASGNLFIADTFNNRIRKVSASGIITTVAGGGTGGLGDDGPATSASLSDPTGVAVDASGNLFIADEDDNRIRKVSASGVITTVAGGGTSGLGDGGPATSASLSYPTGVAVDASGNLFIADEINNRIRKVSASGIITTVAGNGAVAFAGDGGPATSASLSGPNGVTVDASGNLFIADTGNNRIRKVSASGIITTVAGNGAPGFAGDGGPATSAELSSYAFGVAVDTSGNLFIADALNNRIRKVSASGIITTVAGGGTSGLGDGGPATLAAVGLPYGVFVDTSGNLLIADTENDRIRKVSAAVASSSGCNGLPAPGNLQLFIASLNTTNGVVQVNGVVSGASNTPFTWSWGDGATTQGFFPQSHTYSNVQLNYSLQVTTHQTDGSTDCAQLSIQFNAQGAGPITSVTTAYGGAVIAQNDFIVIKGASLVPANTPASGTIWSSAPSFASGLMPTQLGGVSVTVNNKPAFVYFYCSAATDPACPQDQLNILTPLDNTIGSVPVVVTSGGISSPPFTITMQAVAPSFLLFSTAGYIAATHANNTLLGPTSLYPGSSTPAKPGETITLYAVGFGLPTTALVNGSASQSGSLPALPVCKVGGTAAALAFAGLISPGLYQLNLTIPATAANGDNAVSCTYGGSTTPAGDLITAAPPAPTGVTLLHDVTSSTASNPNNVCTVPPSVTSFSLTAPNMNLFWDVTGAKTGDYEETDFYRPDGTVFYTNSGGVATPGSNTYLCFWYQIPIAGAPAASYPGTWTARSYWNHSSNPLYSLSFTVVGATPNLTLTITTSGTGSGAVGSSPAGTSCGSGCLSFAAGTTVTLTTTPNAGSTFAGWSGACSGTGGCTVTMTSNLSVTAAFNLTVNPTPTNVTDANGLTTISSGGITVPVQLTDVRTGAPIAGINVALGLPSAQTGVAVLCLDDTTGRYPLQFITLLASASQVALRPGALQAEESNPPVSVPVQTNCPSSLPANITVQPPIDSIYVPAPPTPSLEDVIAHAMFEAELDALNKLVVQLNLPPISVNDQQATFTSGTNCATAIWGSVKSTGATELVINTVEYSTSLELLPVSVFFTTLDALELSSTLQTCQNWASGATIRAIHLGNQSILSVNFSGLPAATGFAAQNVTVRNTQGQPVPSSLCYVSADTLGGEYAGTTDSTGTTVVNLQPDKYSANLISPGYNPASQNVTIPAPGQSVPPLVVTLTAPGTSSSLSFNSGAPPAATVGVPYPLYSFCTPTPTSITALCNGTNPSGGQPPYHFQLDTLGGFPPLGMFLNLNGLLTGTPTVAGTSNFRVCAVDLSGTSVCQPVSLTVNPGLTGTWSGSFTEFPGCPFAGTLTLTLTQTGSAVTGTLTATGTLQSTSSQIVAVCGSTLDDTETVNGSLTGGTLSLTSTYSGVVSATVSGNTMTNGTLAEASSVLNFPLLTKH